MNTIDNEKAKAAAHYVKACMFHFHQGTLDCEDKVVVFGNRGYDDSKGYREVVILMRAWLVEEGLTRFEFATCDNGYSWAIVVFNYDRKPIYHLVNHKLQECLQQVIQSQTPESAC